MFNINIIMGLIFNNLSLTNLTSVGEPLVELAFDALIAPRTKSMAGDSTTTTTKLTSPDIYVMIKRDSGGAAFMFLKSPDGTLNMTNSNAAFFQGSTSFGTTNMTFTAGFDSGPISYLDYYFKKVAGAFDIVTWTGNAVSNTVSHNLGTVPQMAIVKCLDNSMEGALSADWWTYIKGSDGNGYRMKLNSSNGNFYTDALDNSTASVFSPYEVGYTTGGGGFSGNTSGRSYVGFLFATKANVSYVGSYVGNGAARTINCGFTNGAAFVMIKAVTGTQQWYIFDKARGIGSGNEPYTTLPSVTNEASADLLTADSSGFGLTSSATVNSTGTTYTVLALSA